MDTNFSKMIRLPYFSWSGRILLIGFVLMFVYLAVTGLSVFIRLDPKYCYLLGMVSGGSCLIAVNLIIAMLRGGKDGN